MNQHNGHRRYFLTDIPLEDALHTFNQALGVAGALARTPPELLPLSQAQGRVTAQPIWAVSSSPHYDAAAMDGVAVRSADTVGAAETTPKQLTIGSQAVWVDTGDPLPAGFDAVVMIEQVHQSSDGEVEVMAPVAPWQHVRPLGEDIVATELVLPEGHLLRPVDLGACAAAGVREVAVRRKPKVAILPTGDELVSTGQLGPSESLVPGAIVEFNSLVLAGLGWRGQSFSSNSG